MEMSFQKTPPPPNKYQYSKNLYTTNYLTVKLLYTTGAISGRRESGTSTTLSDLNDFVQYKYFCMETYLHIKQLCLFLNPIVKQ